MPPPTISRSNSVDSTADDSEADKSGALPGRGTADSSPSA
jgi:hypothetical protein